MNRLMIAGTGSGCGKTTVSCALLAAFKNKGINVVSYKCGPDYIDPMFHRKATGVPSYNLDVLLMGEENVRYSLCSHSRDAHISVIEGVMGLYDGVGTGGVSSANHLSAVTDTPVILVVNAKGKAQSVCAEIYGYLNYAENNIQAVILNNISPAMYDFYKSMIEERLHLHVAGFMPPVADAYIKSRHLGLVTACEINDIKKKLSLLAENAEKFIDMNMLISIAEKASPLQDYNSFIENIELAANVNIYVANDNAFCFYYEDNHELLTALGANLRFFSPLNDKNLPNDAHGLILWGGYPELYAKGLSQNTTMKDSILQKIKKGLPVYAECGGYMYLQQSLTDSNKDTYPMIGAIEGHSEMTDRLQKFGYIELTADSDCILCNKGDSINAHSFRYSKSDNEGADFTAAKINGGSTYKCIWAKGNIFAGYPHIHFRGNPKFAEEFIKTCGKFKTEENNGVYIKS